MHKTLALPLLLTAACGALPDGDVGQLSSPLTVTYAPAADTWALPSGGGPRDYGVSKELRTNNILGDNTPNRIYLRFPIDLATVCPTLVSATLRMTSAQLAGPLQVHPHPVLTPWAPGPTGQAFAFGCAANSGASAPFAPPATGAPLAGVVVNQSCTGYSWNITPIVQAYCNGAPNYGVMMAGRAGNLPANFFSMEAAAGRQPQLVIQY